MTFYFAKKAVLISLVGANSALTVQAQSQSPCVPPLPAELAMIVDTPLKCNCFYALVGSGFDSGNAATFNNVFNDDSVQSFAQTGSFYGTDGITEYLNYVYSEDGFVTNYTLIGEPLVLDFTSSTEEQCVASVVERRQLTLNPDLTLNNQEVCLDTLVGTTLYYTLTGNPAMPISISKTNPYIPDILFSVTNQFTSTSSAALEFVCDVIVNTCNDTDAPSQGEALKNKKKRKSKEMAADNKAQKKAKKNKKHSKLKSTKKTMPPKPTEIELCVEKLQKLPAIEGDLTYLDGNTFGCRAVHSVMARVNPTMHCPHITFKGETDPMGRIKCEKSKQTLVTDLHTPQQLGVYAFGRTLLGLPESGVIITMGTCPVPSTL